MKANLVVLLTLKASAETEVVFAMSPRDGILEGIGVFRNLNVLAVAAEGEPGRTACINGNGRNVIVLRDDGNANLRPSEARDGLRKGGENAVISDFGFVQERWREDVSVGE